MVHWTLLTLLLLSSLGCLAEDNIAHVHVAANDQWMVFARNRDQEFHFTLSPYQTPAEIFHLNYTSLGTKTVWSLSIPAAPSILDLIELVFIGGSRNSSERILFHVKLRKDETNQLSLVHLKKTSITSLSSSGIESALGMHPLGTHAFVVGDRAGYVYDMNESRGYDWLSWTKFTKNLYPKAVSVTVDNFVIVGVHVEMIDTIVPTLYIIDFNSEEMAAPVKGLTKVDNVEVTSIRASMSIALRGPILGDQFTIAIGFPSMDIVQLAVFANGHLVFAVRHASAEKGVNFGQTVIFGDHNTYGVLSTALATSPWSTGRVQVRGILFAARRRKTYLV